MPQSLSKLYVHLILSTQHREPLADAIGSRLSARLLGDRAQEPGLSGA